jgi:hypothetical protein
MAFLEKRLRACADDIPSVHATLFAAPLDFTHEQAWALASILAQARFPNQPLDLVPSLTPSLPLPDGMGPAGPGTCEVPVEVARLGGRGRRRRAGRDGAGAAWSVAIPRRSLRLGAGRGTRELLVLADGRVDLTGPD